MPNLSGELHVRSCQEGLARARGNDRVRNPPFQLLALVQYGSVLGALVILLRLRLEGRI